MLHCQNWDCPGQDALWSLHIHSWVFCHQVFLSTILPSLHWIICRSGLFSLFLNCSTNSTFGKEPISAWIVRLLFGLLNPVKATLPEEGNQGAAICSLVLIMHYGLLALLFILSGSEGEVHNLFRLSYWTLKEPPIEMEKEVLGSDPVTPLLHELQWILIGFQMQFRVLVIVVKALHNTRTSVCSTHSHGEEMLQAPSLKSCHSYGI